MIIGTIPLVIVWKERGPLLYLAQGGRLCKLWHGTLRFMPYNSATRARIEGRLWFVPDEESNDTN